MFKVSPWAASSRGIGNRRPVLYAGIPSIPIDIFAILPGRYQICRPASQRTEKEKLGRSRIRPRRLLALRAFLGERRRQEMKRGLAR